MFNLDTQILHPQESNMSPKKGAISTRKGSYSNHHLFSDFIGRNPIWSWEYPSSKLVEDTEKCRHLCYVHPEKLIQDGTREVKLHLGGYSSLVTVF